VLPGDGLAAPGPRRGAEGDLQSVANVLNLEAGLLLFDTTSTCFEGEEEDKAVRGTRTAMSPTTSSGRPRPSRPGSGPTASPGTTERPAPGGHRDGGHPDGITVGIWCCLENTNDSARMRYVKDDMRDWTLSRVVCVADRGSTSAENRRYLRADDHHDIIGEKLRSVSVANQHLWSILAHAKSIQSTCMKLFESNGRKPNLMGTR
jgi:hypothetical protein